MADKKPSGFRFRLPWLLQPSSTPAKEPPTKSPRTTTQISVESSPAQRPPFRPPGKAPAPAPVVPAAAPPMIATPAPAPESPDRSPPQTAPPPPSVATKPSAPKSPIAKTIEPVATQPTKEPQTTTETTPTIKTTGPVSPPQTPSLTPPRQAQSQPSPPQTPPAAKPNSRPSSPSHLPTPPQPNSKPLSPSRTAAQPHDTTPPQATSNPLSPVHLEPSQTRTPPRSPSPSSSQHTDKPSTLPSPPTETTKEVSDIKKSIEMDSNHIPQSEDLALDAKPREITKLKGGQTKSMDSHSMETKPQKPKPITTVRVPLHKEIKDDISKFIHKIATSSSKQSMDEKPASIITIAGDNTGATMHLGLDAIKRGYKLTTDGTTHDAAINGDRSSERDSEASENQETKAIVNSNIQGINNSMMFNSSVSEKSPGVHLGFYRNVANIKDTEMKKTESMEMQRDEVNITPPQKFIYDPTTETSSSVGGVFMDSEADDDAETSGKGYEIEVL